MELNIDNTLKDGGMWHQDVAKRKFRRVSNYKLRNLGLSEETLTPVDTLEVLRESPPNIIIAEAVRNIMFVQNYFKKQHLKKRIKYVMGLGVFQQLHYDEYMKRKILKPSTIKFSSMYRPYIGQDLADKKLVVFRTGGIGDLLFIQPNLRYLKEKYPTCKIYFACGPQYQAMVETWDCIDKLLDLPFPFKYLMEADYHALFEGVIERCGDAHTVNAYNLFSKWLGLDLPDDLLVPQQEAKEDKLEKCKEVLSDWGIDDYVLMQVRASSPIRTPRPKFWVNLITEVINRGYPVVLTDTVRQAENIDEFRKLLEPKIAKKVYNFAPHSETLDCTIALAKLSRLVVATDSALNHIAASLDVPCYGIYGPFPGFIRLKTYPHGDWIDGIRQCAPCYLHGHTPCPEARGEYSPCYDNINIEETVSRMEKFLT